MSFFKKIWNKFKDFATSRDALMFIFFVLISTFLWFSRAGDRRQTHTTNIEVEYIGLTPEIATADSLPNILKITFTDTNKSLIYRKPNINPISIDLTQQIENPQRTIIIGASTIQQLVKDQLPTSAIIQSIEPANIQTTYSRLPQKTVPVMFTGQVRAANQYQLIGDPYVEPQKITIYGQRNAIDTIKQVRTLPAIIENTKGDIQEEINLQQIDNVRFSQNQVTITASAKAFTEKNINIPIQIIGAPANLSIKLFPAEIKVKLHIGVDSYKQFDSSEVRAFVNYDDMLKSKNGTIPVYTATENLQIFDIKVNSENIEFLIEIKQ